MGGMGGPPGMGGMGGGGPPQPPPPKDFPGGAKKARTMLKELRSVLKRDKDKIAAVIAEAENTPESKMGKIGPMIEGATAGICKKYKFQNGFQEAMQSIAAVGAKENDMKIRDLMDDLGEIITGEKSPTRLKKENEELRAKLAECEAKL